ncbi:MAG: ankyrin repeat domain-containing protein [Corticimicrobacter sp.]|uniref:ankyrin repeat domain-containing protein n=1 Tax=Corticimicrobacter sp. TaxID=2678536 RepID=UPI0032DA86E5
MPPKFFSHVQKPVRHLALRRMLAGLLAAATLPVMAADAGNWWFYVTNDRVADIQELLNEGADPNLRTADGQLSAIQAVREGSWGVFDALTGDARIDLNAENSLGETALMYAALEGQEQRVNRLIERGAKVVKLGWTPLHYAAAGGHTRIAALLLDQGALPNAPAHDGVTPLMMAMRANSHDAVQLLLDRGADPEAQTSAGKSVVDFAAERGHRRLARALSDLIAERRAARPTGQ